MNDWVLSYTRAGMPLKRLCDQRVGSMFTSHSQAINELFACLIPTSRYDCAAEGKDTCINCNDSDKMASMLFCSSCGTHFHVDCTTPPLPDNPSELFCGLAGQPD